MIARLPDRFKHSSIKFKTLLFVLMLTLVAFGVLFVLISTTYRNGNIQKGYEENQHAIESIGNELLGKKMEINNFMLDVHVDSALQSDLAALADPAITSDERDRRVRRVVDRLYEYMRKTDDLAMADIHLESARNVMIRAVYSTSVAYSIWEEFHRAYMRRVLESSGEIIVYPSAANRQMVFARAQPMPDGARAYCVAAMLDRQCIMRVLQRNVYKETKLAVLFSADGTISNASRIGLEGQNARELGVRWDEAPGQFLCRGLGSDWACSVSYLPALDMYAAVLTDMRSIDMTTGVVLTSIAMMFVSIFAVAALLAFFVSRWINRPIADLMRQFTGFGKPNGGMRLEVRGHDEISVIAERFNDVLAHQERLIRDNYKYKIQEKNARIALLQVQINPHFVFNTLDIVNWFIYSGKNKQASEVLVSLGEMLRYSTYRYQSFVPLIDEIAQIRNYLFIQLQRYDHGFEAEIVVEPALEQMQIPCLILQPLVENAVKYGVAGMRGEGKLQIRAVKSGDCALLSVRDNGKGMTKEQIERALGGERGENEESIGITNVNERVKLLFGERHALEIDSAAGCYTLVTLRLPLGGGGHYESDHR